MVDIDKDLINQINKERAMMELLCESKKAINTMLVHMKLMYDCTIEAGLGEFQATEFANTYLNFMLDCKRRKIERSYDKIEKK
jgi:hypothetical protein